MESITTRITIQNPLQVAFRFFLNGSPLTAIQILDVMEELTKQHKDVYWAYHDVNNHVTIYSPPFTYQLEIRDIFEIVINHNPAKCLEWLPTFMHISLMQRAQNTIVVWPENGELVEKDLNSLLWEKNPGIIEQAE